MNWALIALTKDCGSEMGQAGIELALDLDVAEEVDIRKAELIAFQDDAAPVLKIYYEAQPS